MWSPTLKVERRLIKPVVFLASLAPSIYLVFALITSRLGFNPVEVVTHQTGIWALRFLLISLAITPLRTLFNMVWVTRFRRMFGLFAFFYASLHFCVYFLWDQSLDFRYVIEDVLERPYITVGFSALLLMVPLAVTSANRLRRRMKKKWNTLHKLVYPIGLLAVLHFIWLVKADYQEVSVYAVIYAVLMGFRIQPFLKAKFARKRSEA